MLGIIVLFLVCIVFFISADSWAGSKHKIAGWAWSENIGWLSLNCYSYDNCHTASYSYGVDYDRNTKTVFGTGWSEHGGWICFGKTCKTEFKMNKTPVNSSPEVNIVGESLLSGWAGWPVLDDDGWLKLLGPIAQGAQGPFYFCRNCDETENFCSFCFTGNENQGSKEICSSCTNCKFVEENPQCDACGVCYEYGVGIDYATNSLAGWAWNGDDENHGFGWAQFHPVTSEAEFHGPYLQVVGDVYSGGNIGSLYMPIAPEGKSNAAFLVQAGGVIKHFDSAQGHDWEQENVEQDFPTQENSFYSDEFGLFDIKGLLAGQYGAREDVSSFAQIDNPMDGKVFYGAGNFVMNQTWIINNGSNKKGNGTLVVRGNLYVFNNMSYQDTPIKKLNQLASLGVIVLKTKTGHGGNIYINAGIKELAGNFYAEGKISTGKSDKELQVSGLMVAHEFDFQRNVFDLATQAPAELITYDGRVMSNTPPGFQSIADSLPEWQ